MTDPVAWSYVDDRRTHRVDTGFRRTRTLEFVIEERALDSDDPNEVYVERHALVEPWEARVHQLTLEARLAMLGTYYRTTGVSWLPLRPPPSRELDLRPLELDREQDFIEFHHYQAREGTHAVTLVGVHEELPRGRRTLLARLDYYYPEVNGGNLQIVHPRLPDAVYRSALASRHVELAEMGFEKLGRDSPGTMDTRSWNALRAVLETILSRLLEERLGEDAEGGGIEGSRARGGVFSRLEAVAVSRRAAGASLLGRAYDVEEEPGPNMNPVRARPPSAMMEDLPDDVVRAMNDPRLLALHTRFLPPGKDAQLIEAGDLAIHRAMRKKRDEVEPHEQHLVSLLEASLLLRRSLIKRTPLEPEVVTRVKHAGAYL